MWDEDDEDDEVDNDEEINVITLSSSAQQVLKFIVLFILSWQAIFRIPNVAIDLVLKFFNILLHKLHDYTGSAKLRDIADVFPSTLLKAQTFQSIMRDNYVKFIVCPKCYCTYHHDDCFASQNSLTKCSFVRFPKHSQSRMRNPCGVSLLKTIKSSSRKTLLRPLKVFCYRNLVEQIKHVMNQPQILDIFSQWKSRAIPNGILADIYDGEVWKSFLEVDGEEFLCSKYNIALTLNVDWFRPYKHVEYSVGAMYIAILNYPRELRYLHKNIFLVGILPGPHEPSKQMNSFLEPLVRDLLSLWKGIEMETSEGIQKVRAALVCVSCDIPASRKLVGFVGHSALKACSKCLKSFPTTSFGMKPDYSGFRRELWPKRELKDHREQGMKWKHAKSLAERIEIERKYGIRFSELLRLSYFDTVRFCVIDPMHNILLGSAKHIIGLWKKLGLFKEGDNEHIQTLVNKFVTPSDVGRIPYKIASGFSSFTADQWKNWTLIFSLIALKETLPDCHYQCWYVFVEACHLICSRAISLDNVVELDRLLMKFCNYVEATYGIDACTPNLHLHGHLKDCFIDYGPSSSFWLFAFERFNGILGSVSTNHQDIEIQLMRKFISSQQVLSKLHKDADQCLIDLFLPFQGLKGSLKHEEIPELPLLEKLSSTNANAYKKLCKLLPPVREGYLEANEVSILDETMKSYFGDQYVKTMIIHTYSKAVIFCGTLYGYVDSSHANSSLIYVTKNSDGTIQPAFVRKYLAVKVILQSDEAPAPSSEHVIFLAGINWLCDHEGKKFFGSNIEVWQKFVPSPGFLCSCCKYKMSMCLC